MSGGLPKHLQLMAASNLDVDQVVWARTKGFSFWPAQVFEEDERVESVPGGTVPVRFLDDNSWTYVPPRDIADFVADYDATYEAAMPKETELRRKFLRAVRVGRQLTGMTGWIQCEACDKWRQFPCTILGLGDGWVCKMNTWDECNSCSVPEQDYSDNPDDDDGNDGDGDGDGDGGGGGGGGAPAFAGDAPTLHPTEQEDVCYLEFHSRDQGFTGKVHVTMTNPPLIYVRDVFGIVWRTDDTRRLNDKYKNHKSKFEHLLKYHLIGAGKSKAVAGTEDLDALLTFFNDDVAKRFIEDGELNALEVLLARAFGRELPPTVAHTEGAISSDGASSSDAEEDGPLIGWSTLPFLSQDQKFECDVRLTKAGLEGQQHVSLTDFLSIVGRMQTDTVTKAAYYVRTRLGSVLPCVRDVPLLPLNQLLAVLRLLPLSIVQEYRENGDEQRFREEVMTFAEMPELLAQEAESWTVTGRQPLVTERPAVPKSPRSPRASSGSTAQAWIGKFVKLKPGVKGFGGCIGQVSSAANGYYLIRLRVSGTSVKVRSADMFMVDESEEDTPDPLSEDDDATNGEGSAAAATAGASGATDSPADSRPKPDGDSGPSTFSLDGPAEDETAGAASASSSTPRGVRNRSGKSSPRRGGALGPGAPNEVEDLAPSEELGYERGRSRCGLVRTFAAQLRYLLAACIPLALLSTAAHAACPPVHHTERWLT